MGKCWKWMRNDRKQDALLDFPGNISLQEREYFTQNFSANFLEGDLKEIRQNVSLFKASLINYFKPRYNENFVFHKPNKSHLSFNKISNTGLKKVSILFGAENFAPRFYTISPGKKKEHSFDLDFE